MPQFPFGEMTMFGNGQWGWLHNAVNAISVTELDT